MPALEPWWRTTTRMRWPTAALLLKKLGSAGGHHGQRLRGGGEGGTGADGGDALRPLPDRLEDALHRRGGDHPPHPPGSGGETAGGGADDGLRQHGDQGGRAAGPGPGPSSQSLSSSRPWQTSWRRSAGRRRRGPGTASRWEISGEEDFWWWRTTS